MNPNKAVKWCPSTFLLHLGRSFKLSFVSVFPSPERRRFLNSPHAVFRHLGYLSLSKELELRKWEKPSLRSYNVHCSDRLKQTVRKKDGKFFIGGFKHYPYGHICIFSLLLQGFPNFTHFWFLPYLLCHLNYYLYISFKLTHNLI